MKKHLLALLISAALLLTGCDFNFGDFSWQTSSDSSQEISSEIESSEEDNTPRLVISGETTVLVGEKIALSAIALPEGTTFSGLTWKSADKTIATVTNSSGRVIGKAAGTVKITATAKTPDSQVITGEYNVTVTVPPTPDPTSITLSKNSVSLRVNGSTTLSATVLPSNSDRTVTWSSSNENLATVSGGKITAKETTGDVTITARTVNGLTASCNVTINPIPDKDTYTIMVYISGSNLESEGGLASMDIEEIRKTPNQPDDINIIFQTGGSTSWKRNIIGGNGTNKVSPNELGRYHIRDNDFIKDTSLEYASMGASNTLRDFLIWGFKDFTAEKYGLILWNHGGAMNGCCYDDKANSDCLTADEVEQAVTAAREAEHVTNKLEFITYDACLMAVQDIAEINSHNFNYMLSSQESEGGYGYDYDAWLPTLYSNPDVDTVELLTKIGDTFLTEEKKYFNDQTQSAFDLSKMASYKETFEAFAAKARTIVTSSSKWSTFKSAIYSAKKYGADDNAYPFDIFDVKSAMNKVKAAYSDLEDEADAVIVAVDEVVAYENHHTGTTGCGINLFCPIYGGTTKATYQKQTNFTNWSTLVSKYGNWYNSWY